MKNKLGLILTILTLGITSASACCMVPLTYEGAIGQKAQEAVIIHDKDREELILRINYQITGKKMPKEFAWVVTVPNEPDSYALADKKLFEDMFYLSEKLLKPISRQKSKSLSINEVDSVEGIELGKRVKIGNYDIQPIRGVGDNAFSGLNSWLTKNGFPTEDPKHMQYFIKNNFTFLCIKITAPNKDESVSKGGMLSPLHLSFSSKEPYYPLLFSSQQGVFDVNLHILTRKEFGYAKSVDTLYKINWDNKNYKRNFGISHENMPKSLNTVFDKTKWNTKEGNWNYNNIRCYQVNGDKPNISDWEKDVFFSLKPSR